MKREDAKKIIGNRPLWERRAMYRALNICPWLNDNDQNQRLEALKALGHGRKRK